MRGGLVVSGQSVRLWGYLRQLLTAPRQGGFTVIEVLIVLAISSALFVSAVLMISGRQNQTAFNQASQQIQAQVQQAMNEVATGFYPSRSNFQCSAVSSGQPPTLVAGAAAQGANSDCIFLGKALQFDVQGTDSELFSIFTITGLRDTGACSSEAACLANARPIVVSPSSATQVTQGYPDNSVDEPLLHGLRPVRMWYNNGSGDVSIGAVAFVSSLFRTGTGSGALSGAGSVNVIAVDTSALGISKLAVAEIMNNNGGDKIAGGTINPSGGVFICFESGGTNDYAIVQIGGAKRDLSVTLTTKEKGGPQCVYP